MRMAWVEAVVDSGRCQALLAAQLLRTLEGKAGFEPLNRVAFEDFVVVFGHRLLDRLHPSLKG